MNVPSIDLSIKFWGRPFKPVALGYCIFMATLFIYNLLDAGAFGSLILGDIVAGFALVSFATLMGGWWGNSQYMARVGLFLAGVVYATRASFLLAVSISTGRLDQGVFLSLGALIVAWGSWEYERRDTVGV